MVIGVQVIAAIMLRREAGGACQQLLSHAYRMLPVRSPQCCQCAPVAVSLAVRSQHSVSASPLAVCVLGWNHSLAVRGRSPPPPQPPPQPPQPLPLPPAPAPALIRLGAASPPCPPWRLRGGARRSGPACARPWPSRAGGGSGSGGTAAVPPPAPIAPAAPAATGGGAPDSKSSPAVAWVAAAPPVADDVRWPVIAAASAAILS